MGSLCLYSIVLSATESVKNPHFRAFPRGRKALLSVICLMRSCSSPRFQLQCKLFPNMMPFQPGGSQLPPLGSEVPWPHFCMVHTAQQHHSFVTQGPAVPLLSQTDIWPPTDLHAACTCPETAGRGGEWRLESCSHATPRGAPWPGAKPTCVKGAFFLSRKAVSY